MTEGEDLSLVEGLKASKPEAFEKLVRDFSPRLLATANRVLRDSDEAEDAVQEALISVWKNIAQFQGAASLSTWAHRIVINVCLAQMRSSRAQKEVSIADESSSFSVAFEGLPAAWTEPGPSLEKRVAMRRSIQRALDEIPEEFRIVLLLRDVEELSSRETAERLEIADALVRQRLHRARTIMAEMLRPELCDGPELTCGGQLDLLLDYIDRALPAYLQQPVHNHIESCPTCAGLLNQYRLTIGIPRAVLELTQVPDVDAEFMVGTVDLWKRVALARRVGCSETAR
jgi:RNA polymerase sigma-70 factor (ECF subfamily)